MIQTQPPKEEYETSKAYSILFNKETAYDALDVEIIGPRCTCLGFPF